MGHRNLNYSDGYGFGRTFDGYGIGKQSDGYGFGKPQEGLDGVMPSKEEGCNV